MLKAQYSEDVVNEPDWLVARRRAARAVFKEKPMPNFIYGLNINLNVDLNLDDISVDNLEKNSKKIVNKDSVVIEEFSSSNQEILKDKLMTNCVPAVDKFTSFHSAFVNNILFVHIPKNTQVTNPIEITTNIQSDTFDHLRVRHLLKHLKGLKPFL